VAKNFCHIPNVDYSWLPHGIFLQLLKHPYLAVKDEWSLYQTVCAYVSAHSTETEPVQSQALMETIRVHHTTTTRPDLALMLVVLMRRCSSAG
jgi:hypothetical protein